MSRRLSKLPWHLRYRVGAKLASDFRRLVIKMTHLHCRVEFNGPVYLGPGFHLNIPDTGQLIVGHGVDFRRGFVCEISQNGRVTIGDGSIFTSNALIQCTTSIDIGKRAVFAQSVLIADGNHRYRDTTRSTLDQGYDFRPVTIGDNVLVLAKCTIVADIGEHSVIGANSVVNKPIPPRSLAGGVPARVIEDLATGQR
jgi:acetyltransferase-like isoleucine patch superfamily enzyme